MNDELSQLFPWLGSQKIEYVGSRNIKDFAVDKETQKRLTGEVTLGYGFELNNQPYVFLPESVVNKGLQKDGVQFYIPGLLRPDFDLQSAQVYDVKDLAKGASGADFLETFRKQGFSDEKGYVIPQSVFNSFKNPNSSFVVENYPIGLVGPEGVATGGIQGIASKDGQKVYSTSSSGRQNSQSFIYFDPSKDPSNSGVIYQSWYEPGEKWYDTTLGKIGIALIVGGTAGLALGGAGAAGGTAAAGGSAAAGGTAAAGGAGIVGTPGVSTIFPVAAPVAPTVTSIAPMAAAGSAAAAGAASNASLYPAVEVAPSFTPAPGSLQAALPGLGVETAASAAPFTAIPGSFQAALPVLGIASAPSLAGNLATASSGISATDALRIANQARGLLGAGQNPIVPQQQGLPQQAGGARGVDYSRLLSLLQLQAGLPGVAPLTAPAQLRQIYQPTLLPNVLSLLG